MNRKKIGEIASRAVYGISVLTPWILSAACILHGRVDLAILTLVAATYLKTGG